jgi:hypothetical protein
MENKCNIQKTLSGISTYAKLCSQRSAIFSLICKDHTRLMSSAHSATINTISKKGKQRESESTLSTRRAKRLWLGERSISFQQGSIGIVISWEIIIDDDGFAGSNIFLSSKIPAQCNILYELSNKQGEKMKVVLWKDYLAFLIHWYVDLVSTGRFEPSLALYLRSLNYCISCTSKKNGGVIFCVS